MAPARAEPERTHVPAPLPQAVLDDAQRLACLRLACSENVGPVTFRELINLFGGAGAALAAVPERSRRGGLRRSIRITPASEAEAVLAAARKIGARIVFTIEPGYPRLLAETVAPPPFVFLKGKPELFERHAVGIVGSRNCSTAGIAIARQLASGLAAKGFVVVSGLARGIDRAAHEVALATGTIGVVAGGIDVVYPPEHAELQGAIAEIGCLVAEHVPGIKPRGRDFPRRNRIISGLSRGVVVVEAAERSGALITARYALDQGREVFAVPGHPLDPRASGTNGLIKSGACLVRNVNDILEELAPQLCAAEPPAANLAPPDPWQAGDDVEGDALARVAAALGPAPVTIDAVASATQLPVRAVRVALLELDLAGRVERHGGSLVSLRASH